MAGKYGSTSAIFWVDGYNFLAAALKTLRLKIVSITEQVDGLGDPSEKFAPVGKQQGMVTQGGAIWDTATASVHDAMATKLGVTPQDTPRVMVVGMMGNTVGAVLYGIAGAFSVAYEAALEIGKFTKANAEHLLAGLIERGQIVQPLATKSADWNTHALGTPVDFALDPSQYTRPITSNSAANPTVVTTPVPHGLVDNQVIVISGVVGSDADINGEQPVTVIDEFTFSVPVDATTNAGTGGSFVLASTVNGGGAYQQVGPFSGLTGYIGKLRHSADETTYADLATFTNVTAARKAQRVEIALGTTINRYVVHDGDVTGTGELDVLSALARRW